ncbi:MAG: glycerol-3-phosphate dehydrogenase/oxidase [Pseudolysinimonas sp.]
MSEPDTPSRAGQLNADQRAAAIVSLRSHTLDVLVIGGGIVGAGAALDAASRGLHVGIIEAHDWASGTSSRSSKLVHGGIRYLERLEFKLVREALIERGLLLTELAPHLVKPVPFLYPVRIPIIERAYIGAGMLLYDLLSYSGGRRPGVGLHRHITRRQLRRQMPSLSPNATRGGLRYFDGQVDDARLVATIVRTAVSAGAVAASRMEAVAIRDGGSKSHTVVARDGETGELFEIRARAIVNATGVWTAESQDLLGAPTALGVTMSKGVHIVVGRDRFRSELGLILRAGKSVLFVIPWGQSWIIGTTDTPWHFDKSNPAATATDIDYLLAQVNRVLETPIAREDIRAVYAGLRPLVSGRAGSTAQLSREHVVDVPAPGIAVVAGGKLTTYRIMARDAVSAAVKGRLIAQPSRTEHYPLIGARGLAAANRTAIELVRSYGLPEPLAERLLGRYGDRLDEVLQPVQADPSLGAEIAHGGGAILAEASYAVTHEGALHLQDVLERRLRVSIESSDFGLAAAAEVALLMAQQLGWDDVKTSDELASYRLLIEQQREAMDLRDDESANACMTALA